jgi:hypothetical protein
MNDEISSFLDRLDEALIPLAKEGERFDMYLLGRSALLMLYGFPISTRDIDVVDRQNPNLDQKAVELFGKNTAMAETLGMYLDLVSQGLPPLPHWSRKRAEAVPGSWQVLRLWKLEAHDLAATKLKSFRPKDRQDLQACATKAC